MSSVFVMLLLALTAGMFQHGSNTGATNVVSAFVMPQGKSHHAHPMEAALEKGAGFAKDTFDSLKSLKGDALK